MLSKLHLIQTKFLTANNRDRVQLLINQIFSLPTEKADLGALAKLPAPTTAVPREKPIPKPKAPTKWEEFAKKKGIVKKQKDRVIWDEASQSWKPRFGRNRVNDIENQLIYEHSPHENLKGMDPFTHMEAQRKKHVEINQANQAENKLKKQGSSSKKLHYTSIVPTANRLRDDIHSALAVARFSNASVGKFEPTLENEPRFKENTRVAATEEKETQMRVLNGMLRRRDTLDVNSAMKGYTRAAQQKASATPLSVQQRQLKRDLARQRRGERTNEQRKRKMAKNKLDDMERRPH